MPMTPDAKAALSSTIRALRSRLLAELHVAMDSAYRLGIPADEEKHGWDPEVEADGTLARLEERHVAWRAKRDAEAVSLTALMPLEGDAERRWAYYVRQAHSG